MPNHQSSQPGQPNGTRIADEVQQSDTERLATVGRLVTKIAHELNNPLDGILRYLNLSMRALEQDNLEKPKEYLQQCRRGLMRMVQITSQLLEFARTNAIDLTVVGPEAPLCAGIVDAFGEAGLRIFGPTARAARIEGSKVFAKELMTRYNVPTAPARIFDNAGEAAEYVTRIGAP